MMENLFESMNLQEDEDSLPTSSSKELPYSFPPPQSPIGALRMKILGLPSTTMLSKDNRKRKRINDEDCHYFLSDRVTNDDGYEEENDEGKVNSSSSRMMKKKKNVMIIHSMEKDFFMNKSIHSPLAIFATMNSFSSIENMDGRICDCGCSKHDMKSGNVVYFKNIFLQKYHS